MTIHIDPTLKVSSALREASMMGWARAHFHIVATAYFAPGGRITLGAIESARLTDLKDTLLLTALKAGVLPHAYQAVLAPNVATIAFAHGGDYLKMMTAIKGEYIAQGSDLCVHVSGRDATWHQFAYNTHLWMVNHEQAKAGGKLVRVEDRPGGRKDYIFPDIRTMANFCEYVDSGRIDRLLTSFLRNTPATPPAL